MAEPQIRYVRSADGTKIATATVGEGRPLVLPFQIPTGTIELNWTLSEWGVTGLREYARHFTLVMFEPRGQGLSDRDVDDLSLEARVADMKAVFDGLGIERAAVLARGLSGPYAIAFAARHAE